MLIRDLFKQKKRTLSFEVFPPVREGNLESLFATIAELRELKPDFISVTYGAVPGLAVPKPLSRRASPASCLSAPAFHPEAPAWKLPQKMCGTGSS